MSDLSNFFLTREFIPHGNYYLWQPSLVSLHVVSDVLIALAYYLILLILVYLVGRRRALVEVRIAKRLTELATVNAVLQAKVMMQTQQLETQMAELKRLQRLKDDFLSTVSHELRTPMANIKMAVKMLELALLESRAFLHTTPQSSSEYSLVPRYLQILNNECEREIALINNLLDLQRLEAGTQLLTKEIIHFQTWLPQLVEDFQERAQHSQLTLRVDIPADIPPLVCDSASLKRIIAELIKNACKYTPPGEKITVIACTQKGRMHLQVSNSGVEIPAHELDRIFDKFYRVPSANPWKQGGTGLGLALVQKLTKHLGGDVWVESAFGQTCFTVALLLNGTDLAQIPLNPNPAPASAS